MSRSDLEEIGDTLDEGEAALIVAGEVTMGRSRRRPSAPRRPWRRRLEQTPRKSERATGTAQCPSDYSKRVRRA
jgi:hypothetical protein